MDGGGGLPVVTYLLQQTLRGLCTDSEWVYAVFWRILPRSYPPPKWDTENNVLDWSKGNKRNWILVWEDGFCDFFACARAANESAIASYTSLSPDAGSAAEDCSDFLQPEIFFKMSHEVYNFGEGLMGKVAADNSHRWVYKEPVETDLQYPPSWQSALDPHPRTWDAQFKCGIETIAIVAVKEGLLQLGSFRKIDENPSFVLCLQQKFNRLQSIPGVFATHPLQQIAIRKIFPSGNGSELSYAAEFRAGMPTGAHQPLQQMVGMKRLAEGEASMSRCCSCGAPSAVDYSPGFCENCLPRHSHNNSHSPSSSPNPKSLKPSFDIAPQHPPAASFPLLLPSMSSLQALLSKLPPVHPPQRCCVYHRHPESCSPSASAPSLLNAGSSPHGGRLQDRQPRPPLPPLGVGRLADTPSLASAPAAPPLAAAAAAPSLPAPGSGVGPSPARGAVPQPPTVCRHPPQEPVAELARPVLRQAREGCTAVEDGYNNAKGRGGASADKYEKENLSIYENCYQLREASFLHETSKLPSFFDSIDTAAPSEYKPYDDFDTYNSLLREINS